jgi:hypothetical protein
MTTEPIDDITTVAAEPLHPEEVSEEEPLRPEEDDTNPNAGAGCYCAVRMTKASMFSS